MDVILDSDMYKYKNDIKQHSVDVVSFNSTEKKKKNIPHHSNVLTYHKKQTNSQLNI